jgi:hypothetical protein
MEKELLKAYKSEKKEFRMAIPKEFFMLSIKHDLLKRAL